LQRSISLKSHTIKARLVFSHAKVEETASAPAAAPLADTMPNGLALARLTPANYDYHSPYYWQCGGYSSSFLRSGRLIGSK
jgi:hypothetical protein